MHHSLIGRCVAAASVFLGLSVPASAQPPGAFTPDRAGVQSALPPLTIEEAVAAVLAHSPVRQAAEARAEASRSAAQVAGVWLNPSLEVRAENWTFGNWQWAPTTDPARAPVDFFTVLTQPVELGGKRGSRRRIAEFEERAAAAELAGIDRMLVLQTVRVYLDVIRSRELLAALARNQESVDELVRALDARVREGVAAPSDLARFRAEAARVSTEVLRTRIELERNVTMLVTLSGNAAFGDAARVREPVPPPPPAAGDDEIVARIVEASPDVLAARARASAATESATLERARRVPDLGVAGGYKRTAGLDSAVFGVLVTLPVFDRNDRGVALASGEARAFGFEARAAAERAAGEARILVRHARALAERAASVERELIEPADLVREAARAAFHEGAAEILGLVDAERLSVDAHREALQVKLDAVAAAFELKLKQGEEIHR